MNVQPFLMAIDPGGSGGVAWWNPFDSEAGVSAKANPADEVELSILLCSLLLTPQMHPKFKRAAIAIELVGGFVRPPRVKVTPGENGEPPEVEVEGQPGSAMFRFGESAGLVRGMLRVIQRAYLNAGGEFEILMVRPVDWQRAQFLKKGNRSKEDWKRSLKASAERLFPGVKATLKTADALLLLRFAVMRYAPAALSTLRAAQGPIDGAPKRKAAAKKTIPSHLNPPEGYVLITTGTTDRFDLVWNKDLGRWEPAHLINAYVNEYHSVCRPVVDKLRELIRERCNMSLNEAMKAGETAFIVRWKTAPWVAYQGKSSAVLSKQATAIDLMTYPPANS